MVWWNIDDKLHSNTKIRKVVSTEPAAMALWAMAGSWSSAELTDGFIPDSQLQWLIPAGAEQLAQVLINERLWRRVRGGYQFHQWLEDGDGTKRNRSAKEVREQRQKKVEAGRIGGLTSGKTRRKTEAVASSRASPTAKPLVEPLDPYLPLKGKGRSASATLREAQRSHPNPEPTAAELAERERTYRTGAARARAALNGNTKPLRRNTTEGGTTP